MAKNFVGAGRRARVKVAGQAEDGEREVWCWEVMHFERRGEARWGWLRAASPGNGGYARDPVMAR